MTDEARLRITRNCIAAFLVSYGCVAFFGSDWLESTWRDAAPEFPNAALGFLYRHNNRGAYTYFSQFQTTAIWLLSNTSLVLTVIGILIAPRKKADEFAQWPPGRLRRELDDPEGVVKLAAAVSVVASLFFIFIIGPHIVRGLNSIGVVLDAG